MNIYEYQRSRSLTFVQGHLESYFQFVGPGSLVGYASTWHVDSRGLNPHVWQYSFIEIGYEIMSTAILSLLLIQVGQLSVTGERMCT